MKKGLILFSILLMSLLTGGVLGYLTLDNPNISALFLEDRVTSIEEDQSKGNYIVKKNNKIIGSYKDKEQALQAAEKEKRIAVIDQKSGKWIYTDLQPYMIITDQGIHDFDDFSSAVNYAKKKGFPYIYYKDDKTQLWREGKPKQEKHIIKVPFIKQLPELPRGCEVTSLTMIFNYYGNNISKMQLAEEIKKDTTPYKKDENGRVYYGNPYEGFVGDMYNWDKNGYGVYHGPIAELGEKYFTDRAIDITGVEFEDLLKFIEEDIPVWVITNATYKSLPESEFELWHTPTEIVKITKRLHSVVLTGYDKNKVYINDPLYNKSNRSVNKEEFRLAWEQMGKQAVIIIPER